MTDRGASVRVELAEAASSAQLAAELAMLDPSWGSAAEPLAGGWLVLCGKGLYVNRAIGVGIAAVLEPDDLEVVVARSLHAGVPPQVDVTPATHPGTVALLVRNGFEPEPGGGMSMMVFPNEAALPDVRAIDVVIATVGERSLDEWIAVSARGFAHETESARRAADAFARAAWAVDGDGMVIAIDTADGQPVASASLTLNGDVASLGGMSTVPAARRRGVQAAMIRHRIDVARRAGATTVWSSAVSGSASERNLLRHGFEPLHLRLTYVQQ